ncbi:hypothetical protein BCh11DRAFT_03927 [Burkholderia sp. Ch1-1]|nr:hypothetical protein BCh11DRAFT_03927 [Burkholderia sp. Ch1-1]
MRAAYPIRRKTVGTPYQMNGFFGVWSEALGRDEPTVAFEVSNGRGRFLFMMFFDPEDEKTKDRLFLFLQNTRAMLPLKLYGSHRAGDFRLYLDSRDVEKIKRELQIEDGTGPAFDIGRFIDALNASIPQSVPLATKVGLLRQNRSALREHLPDIVDFHDRTELIGEMNLPEGKKPKERTLRKLYLYSTDSPEDVAAYIKDLKRRNVTLSWRVPANAA